MFYSFSNSIPVLINYIYVFYFISSIFSVNFKIPIEISSIKITIPLQIIIYIISCYCFFIFLVIFYRYINPDYLGTRRLMLLNKKTILVKVLVKRNIRRIYFNDYDKKTNILLVKFNRAEMYMINYCNRYIALFANIICYILMSFKSNSLYLSHYTFTISFCLYENLIFFLYLIWLLYPIFKKTKSHIKSLESIEK